MTDKKDNVVVLGFHADNGNMITPTQLLEEVIRELADPESAIYKTKKVVVLLLNDDDRIFSVLYRQCGCKCSEMLALVDCFKKKVFNLMGY